MAQVQLPQEFADAQDVKGSVTDTWKDWYLRQGKGDSFGGLGANPIGGMSVGVVANEASPVFQKLLQAAPRFARGLQRVPQTLEYLDKPVEAFRRGVRGVTTGIPPERLETVAQDLAAGVKIPRGPVQITPDELGRLVQYSRQAPGSTLQSIKPGEPLSTTIHEALHGVYAPKNPLQQTPNVSPARGRELMARVLGRTPGLTMDQKVGLLDQYYNQTPHGLLEAIAQYRAEKLGAQGGMAVGK